MHLVYPLEVVLCGRPMRKRDIDDWRTQEVANPKGNTLIGNAPCENGQLCQWQPVLARIETPTGKQIEMTSMRSC
jgi:hypothetical protein